MCIVLHGWVSDYYKYMDYQAKKLSVRERAIFYLSHIVLQKKDCSTKAINLKFGVCMYHVCRYLQKEALITIWNNDIVFWQFVQSKTVA